MFTKSACKTIHMSAGALRVGSTLLCSGTVRAHASSCKYFDPVGVINYFSL